MTQRTTVCSLLLAAVPCLATPAFADSTLNTAIDAVFSDIGQDEPGCAVGVIHEGEFMHRGAYGLANMEHGIPLSSSSVFRIGSVSKQFTAMAIALLAERGDLDLDADVHDYLPDLVDYGHTVTVRQMVHHVAGMGDYDHDVFRRADGSEFRFGNEDYWTIDEFYQAVARAGLVREPGTEYLYSNLAYFLLAMVVERVSGQTLREFANAQIFVPLGMSSTRFNDNVNEIVPQRADGYRLRDDGQWEIFMTNLSWVGDGGVYTSIDDFIRWDRNFYANRLGAGTAALIELVETPLPGVIERTANGEQPVSYAFGMNVVEHEGLRAIRHSGGWVAFSTMYERYPELELSVVVFCNSAERSGADYAERVRDVAIESVAAGRRSH